MTRRKSIVVPTSSKFSACGVSEVVMQVASLLNTEVHVLHVFSEDNVYDDFSNAFELFQLACEENGVRVKSVSTSGNVVQEIVRYAEHINASLILMGANADESVEEWISHQVFGNTCIPVLVMPNSQPFAFSIHSDLKSVPDHERKPWALSNLFRGWRW